MGADAYSHPFLGHGTRCSPLLVCTSLGRKNGCTARPPQPYQHFHPARGCILWSVLGALWHAPWFHANCCGGRFSRNLRCPRPQVVQGVRPVAVVRATLVLPNK